MRIIRAGEWDAMPWKNGGGITYEVAVFPEGAALNAFDWRVSMARVDRDGPFSMFPGIDRSLAIVEGDGLTLQVAGRGNISLRRGTPPVPFPADAGTTGTLTAGPVLDLNVMTRRAAWSHRMALRHAHDGLDETRNADVRIVIVREGRLSIQGRQCKIALSSHDTIVFETKATALQLAAELHTTFFQIDLLRRAKTQSTL